MTCMGIGKIWTVGQLPLPHHLSSHCWHTKISLGTMAPRPVGEAGHVIWAYLASRAPLFFAIVIVRSSWLSARDDAIQGYVWQVQPCANRTTTPLFAGSSRVHNIIAIDSWLPNLLVWVFAPFGQFCKISLSINRCVLTDHIFILEWLPILR